MILLLVNIQISQKSGLLCLPQRKSKYAEQNCSVFLSNCSLDFGLPPVQSFTRTSPKSKSQRTCFFSTPFFKDLYLESEVEIEEGEEKEITEEGGYHSSRRGTTQVAFMEDQERKLTELFWIGEQPHSGAIVISIVDVRFRMISLELVHLILQLAAVILREVVQPFDASVCIVVPRI